MTSAANLTYWCRPTHARSAPNALQYINFQYNVTHALDLSAAYVWVTPLEEGDALALAVDENDSVYFVQPSYSSGILTLRVKSDIGHVGLQLWVDYLTKVMYGISKTLPLPCVHYEQQKVLRTFALQVVDKFQRKSNVIYRNMVVQTSFVMYTSDNVMEITDYAKS